MEASSRTKAQWVRRIEPALAESMEAVRAAITNHPEIQDWLHSVPMEVAQGVPMDANMQAAAQVYHNMMDDLRERFPGLVDAVRETTDGCGQLDFHWRPLSPQFSAVSIDFGVDDRVKVFDRLKALNREEARRALARIADALPKSDPFPGHPHTSIGIIAYEGQCLPVRLRATASENDGQRRTCALLPKGQRSYDGLTEEEAARGVVEYFRQTG